MPGVRRNRGRGPNQQIADADKRAECLKLKREGLTYDQIAQRMGYAYRGAARDMVHRALDDLWVKPAEDVRNMELERLDKNHHRCERIIRAHMDEACQKGIVVADEKTGEVRYVITTDAVKSVLDAIKGQTTVSARRAKLLGLDAAEEKTVTVKTGATPAEARRIMQEMFGDNVRPPEGAEAAAPDIGGPEEGTTTH